jgi:acetyl-CoA C-acetyltransferase
MLVGSQVRRVAVVGGMRIPFARGHGAYARVGNQDMYTAVLQALVAKFRIAGERLGEVTGGAVLKHSKDFNLVRECVMSSGLDPATPGIDMQRACGTGLDAAINVAMKIALGQIDAGIAGGFDTVSDPPVVFPREYQQILLRAYRGKSLGQKLGPFLSIRPRHFKPVMPGVLEPRTGLSMGEHCEQMAKTWKIPRAEQDALANLSHVNAGKAWARGFFSDLVVGEYQGLRMDNNVRADSTVEKLGALKPAFDRRSGLGTLTAGNSTPLTDGASAVLLASEVWARARNLPILAWFSYSKQWAVDYVSGKEGLLMAPAYAVPAMLRDANLTLQDFDFYEIHEAFAAQVLCTLKAWESPEYCRERLGLEQPLGSIDRARLNVNGSSVAMGHPFAATGTRIVASLAKQLAESTTARRGLISVCTAGGMGVVAILEKA